MVEIGKVYSKYRCLLVIAGTLKEVQSLVTFPRVTCKDKVVGVDEVEEVSGTIRLTLWEEEVGKMAEGGRYKLCGMVVREFRREKFLLTSKQNFTIAAIDNIGDVEAEEYTAEEGNILLSTMMKLCSTALPCCRLA